MFHQPNPPKEIVTKPIKFLLLVMKCSHLPRVLQQMKRGTEDENSRIVEEIFRKISILSDNHFFN